MNLSPLLLPLLETIPYIILFLFGISIGSFLNVCIYRIPLGQSVVTAPSHCMTCGSRLHWYDMIPVLSWLVLHGRCRNCKTPISPQYPLIEATNGLLYLWIFAANGWNTTSAVYALMSSALLTLSIIDWRTQEIPVQINYFLAVLGLAATALHYNETAALSTLINHIAGAVSVSGFLLILYLLSKGRAIGGGDIKLMAACGLILGWQKILLAFLLGCILGSVIHLIRMKAFHADHTLALGPYLSAGILLTALYGDLWIHSYMKLLGI